MIAIGVSEAMDELRDRLDLEFRQLAQQGVGVTIKPYQRGNWSFLGCNIEAPVGLESSVAAVGRDRVARVLSDLILTRWEERLLRRLVTTHYGYFAAEEQEQIRQMAYSSLHSDESARTHTTRRTRILARLQEYLERHDELIVDGFITFRLKDYVAELETAIDQAVDEYLIDKEYREFIHLLRYFVEVQEPRLDRVHVLLVGEAGFQLFDDHGVLINNDYLAEFVVELSVGEVDYEDLLISALITIAPRQIVLHLPEQGEPRLAVQTIGSVFGNRVTQCKGCPKCRGR